MGAPAPTFSILGISPWKKVYRRVLQKDCGYCTIRMLSFPARKPYSKAKKSIPISPILPLCGICCSFFCISAPPIPMWSSRRITGALIAQKPVGKSWTSTGKSAHGTLAAMLGHLCGASGAISRKGPRVEPAPGNARTSGGAIGTISGKAAARTNILPCIGFSRW